MDETIKIIIATLSGFVIAFFAEPVKIYFQNSAKLEDLRIALYKEMEMNFFILDKVSKVEYSLSKWRSEFSEFSLRIECYKHAVENEVSLFYQLNEANTINILQGNFISQIIEAYREIKSLPGDETNLRKELTKTLIRNTILFRNIFGLSVNNGGLSKKILADTMAKATLEKVMVLSKELGEKDFSEPETINLID
jgi:hypothetical protein